MSVPRPRPKLNLADANALLISLREVGDWKSCLEVLSNMKLAGIGPDAASYHTVIAALARGGEGWRAVEACLEGHDLGALRHFSLPQAAPTPGAHESLSSVVDVAGCCVEVGVAVWQAWAARLRALQQHTGAMLEAPWITITLAKEDSSAAGTDKDSVCHALVQLLTVGGHAAAAAVALALADQPPKPLPSDAGECLSSSIIKFSLHY